MFEEYIIFRANWYVVATETFGVLSRVSLLFAALKNTQKGMGIPPASSSVNENVVAVSSGLAQAQVKLSSIL